MGDSKDSQKFVEFAKAFLKEAREDLVVADELLESKRYARSVFSSQQCVEKSVKALLEAEGIFAAEHDLSALFVKFIYKNEKYAEFKKILDSILENIDYFEGEWSKTRYPKEKDGKIVIPIEVYKQEEAVTAYGKAEEVFDSIKEILIKKFNFKF
jgi:HEPN domain-containing protein